MAKKQIFDEQILADKTFYDVEEIKIIKRNFTENEILIDNQIYISISEDELENIIELSLTFLAGAGMIKREKI